jgi:hypothetical protein
MHQVNYLNLVDKAKRHDRQQQRKDSSLAALVAGSGEVLENGRFVALPRVDGSTVVYGVTIDSAKICFHRDDRHEKRVYANRNGKGHGHQAATVVGPRETVRAAMDTILNVLGSVEKRANFIFESDPKIAAE